MICLSQFPPYFPPYLGDRLNKPSLILRSRFENLTQNIWWVTFFDRSKYLAKSFLHFVWYCGKDAYICNEVCARRTTLNKKKKQSNN